MPSLNVNISAENSHQTIAVQFGRWIKEKRLEKQTKNPSYSLRQVAKRIEVEPSYLSKVERGLEKPPSEKKLKQLAKDLNLDSDVVLARAGKVDSEIVEIIRIRPKLFSKFLRRLKLVPDEVIEDAIMNAERKARLSNRSEDY